eukprot:GILK01000961.1.p1 GENE.GILK01000961.1~~GILK01000961.1.p1  ORF type:complete len:388 (+),score=68.51 GILK01000961.1:48-1166(+)
MAEEKYSFLVNWFDTSAALVRSYQLSFYPGDNSLEMYDIKNKRSFLKRCEYSSVRLEDLFIGAQITVYARKLELVDYADVFTRNKLETKRAKTFAMIKPDAYQHIGKILDAIYKNGFVVGKLKMVKLSAADAQEFYAEHRGKPFFNDLVAFMSRDPVVAMELVADNAVSKWRSLIGPTNVDEARQTHPQSLRALFGTSNTFNAVHGADSAQSATRESNFFFSNRRLKTSAVFNNCTCGVIRPHAVQSGKAGEIIDSILEEGFDVSAIELFNLDKTAADEFLDVYKGVLPEHHQLVETMSSGPCIAMEIRQENAVEAFRQLAGPHDPEIAKHLRPNTLRARFGLNRVENAIHATDLPEDGLLEVEYFFKILQV